MTALGYLTAAHLPAALWAVALSAFAFVASAVVVHSAAYGTFAWLAFSRGLRRYESGSRFGVWG